MANEVSWDTPGKALRLKLCGDLALEAFAEIDRQINERLQESDGRVVLVVDASDAKFPPYGIEPFRSSQTYLQSHQIEQLVVVSNSKLNRLAMLLLFNLCRPKLLLCDNFDEAQRFLAKFNSSEFGVAGF